ncbi:hypothetical protein KW785_02280 [Candidatus Parcubacteria bacterium]|nr:hypothetical protein [Candidatus Parcubacteria bacterium]
MTKRDLQKKIRELAKEAEKVKNPGGIPELLFMVANAYAHDTRGLALWCKFYTSSRLMSLQMVASRAADKAVDEAVSKIS